MRAKEKPQLHVEKHKQKKCPQAEPGFSKKVEFSKKRLRIQEIFLIDHGAQWKGFRG